MELLTNLKTKNMKTKFQIDIHAGMTSESENILRAISNHNEGKAAISLDDLIGYCKVRNSMYPSITDLKPVLEAGSTLRIYEGDKLNLTILLIELHELKEETEPLFSAMGLPEVKMNF